MRDMLSGKWVWVWNWRRCLDGNAIAVARRLKDAGCRGAFVKSDDGGHPFDQGRPVWEIVQALQQEGLLAGLWGYVYGCDTPTVIYGDLKYTATEEAAMAARFITERPSLVVSRPRRLRHRRRSRVRAPAVRSRPPPPSATSAPSAPPPAPTSRCSTRRCRSPTTIAPCPIACSTATARPSCRRPTTTPWRSRRSAPSPSATTPSPPKGCSTSRSRPSAAPTAPSRPTS